MQDEDIGFWSFPKFFEYCIRQETNFSRLIQVLFKKNIWKNQVLKLGFRTVGTRNKTPFLTSTTTVDTKQMSNVKDTE